MIPRIELHHVSRINEERSAFTRGPKERSLRIVVDRATASEDDTLTVRCCSALRTTHSSSC